MKFLCSNKRLRICTSTAPVTSPSDEKTGRREIFRSVLGLCFVGLLDDDRAVAQIQAAQLEVGDAVLVVNRQKPNADTMGQRLPETGLQKIK